ncbi:MAG: Protein-L-isoaspartate O-methyltransferase [Rhodanobacteraceae bacterium]|jgi:dienelactone hydrolase|nr:MAG: Protein-L-isoaspartate O-methyltransferase [Rhodanobacteraceae bacterium]
MSILDSRDVTIRAGNVFLEGTLTIPAQASGIIAFAHGSGSGRFSPRNRNVARALNGTGFATLLLDLLTASENERDELTAEFRFDIPLLARRLTIALNWLAGEPATRALPIGLFGASTGAAAALIAAATCPELVRAVVSRGGRPDLAGAALEQVGAPTLLIVGGDDTQVIALNRQAAQRLHCQHELAVVPGASHLFEEWGALDRVTELAADWFRRHLGARTPAAAAS